MSDNENGYVRTEMTHTHLKRLSVEEIVGIALMVSICGVMGLGIFFRYVLNYSLSWTEEISRYGLIYITFIGTSTAIKHDSHIRIDVLDRILGRKAKIAIKVVNDSITLVFLMYMVYVSYQIIVALRSTKSPALQIPMSYLYISAFVGFGMASVRVIVRYLRKIS